MTHQHLDPPREPPAIPPPAPEITTTKVVVGDLRPLRAADRRLKRYWRLTGGRPRVASRPGTGEGER